MSSTRQKRLKCAHTYFFSYLSKLTFDYFPGLHFIILFITSRFLCPTNSNKDYSVCNERRLLPMFSYLSLSLSLQFLYSYTLFPPLTSHHTSSYPSTSPLPLQVVYRWRGHRRQPSASDTPPDTDPDLVRRELQNPIRATYNPRNAEVSS